MIPKIIHYCWFGGNPLPGELQKYVETWKKYCPDYEIKLWNEESFDIDSHVFTKTAYAARKFAYVSDYVRAYALNKFGGIYLDTDVELKKSLDVFLSHEAFTGFEAKGSPFTALWASIPEHSLTQKVLSYYDGREYLDSQETNTKSVSASLIDKFGIDPTKNILQVGNDGINSIHIYPAEYFCLDLLPNYATHHFFGSWLPNKKDSCKDFLHAQYYLDKATEDREYRFSVLNELSKKLSYKELIKLALYRLYNLYTPGYFKKVIIKIKS